MELADVTDSKSVGSNTVRVRPPPSAPKSVTPLNEWGYTFLCVGGWENPQLAGRARMHDSGRSKSLHDAATQTTANARMRDSACPKFRTMRNQQSKHDSTTPPHFRSLNEWGIIFGAGAKRWWRDNPFVLTAEKFAI